MIKIIQAKAYIADSATLGSLAKGYAKLDAQHVFFSDPNTDMSFCGWRHIGEAEIHLKDPPTREQFVAMAIAALDEKEAEKLKELNKELQKIRQLKSELLAIGMVAASPEEL